MQYRQFGRTGLNVSRLCLGTMTFGLQTEEQASQRILDTAAEAGVNFIDTANVYPLGGGEGLAGRTEEIVGRWLKGKRDRFILATKAVGKMGPAAWDQGASRKHLLDAIDASLRRLGTDYVDLYQLHSDDANTPLDETLEALDVIVRSGKARYVGVSNFLAYRLARALGRADVLRVARFVSVQPRYNLLFRQIERELLPLAAEEHLAVMPYNPLAGGLLTGKHKLDATPTSGRFTETVGKGRRDVSRALLASARIRNDRALAGDRVADRRVVDAHFVGVGAGESADHVGDYRREPCGAIERHACGVGAGARRADQNAARRGERGIPLGRRGALGAAAWLM